MLCNKSNNLVGLAHNGKFMYLEDLCLTCFGQVVGEQIPKRAWMNVTNFKAQVTV